MTALQFSEHFKQSKYGREASNRLDEPFDTKEQEFDVSCPPGFFTSSCTAKRKQTEYVNALEACPAMTFLTLFGDNQCHS